MGMVSLLKLSNGQWNDIYLAELFNQTSMLNIKRIFWAKNNQEVKIIWLGTKTGSFSDKSANKVEEGISNGNDRWWKFVWKSQIHETSKFFLWKLSNRGLPVLYNLMARRVKVDCPSCLHGCEAFENEEHVFFFFMRLLKGYSLLVPGT